MVVQVVVPACRWRMLKVSTVVASRYGDVHVALIVSVPTAERAGAASGITMCALSACWGVAAPLALTVSCSDRVGVALAGVEI